MEDLNEALDCVVKIDRFLEVTDKAQNFDAQTKRAAMILLAAEFAAHDKSDTHTKKQCNK